MDRIKQKQLMENYRESSGYDREYYQANKDKWRVQSRKNRRELLEWYREIKSQESCIICAESDPSKLHFHHRDPRTKVDAVSNMINQRLGKQRILDEMAKCDVLCMSCHIAFHDMYDKDDDNI